MNAEWGSRITKNRQRHGVAGGCCGRREELLLVEEGLEESAKLGATPVRTPSRTEGHDSTRTVDEIRGRTAERVVLVGRATIQ
ncbi:MAG: hypothetical protein Q7R69_01655 [bacterium]|nr:hypothetical protein [bacterium]